MSYLFVNHMTGTDLARTVWLEKVPKVATPHGQEDKLIFGRGGKVHLIVVEGMVGAGKSYLMNKIKELSINRVVVIEEDVDLWCQPVDCMNGLSMLGAANEFPSEYGLLFQVQVLCSRLAQLKGALSSVSLMYPHQSVVVVCERHPASDRAVFLEILARSGFLTKGQLHYYNVIQKAALAGVEVPTVAEVWMVEAEPAQLSKQRAMRDRKEERLTSAHTRPTKHPVDEAYESLDFSEVYGVEPKRIKSGDIGLVTGWLRQLIQRPEFPTPAAVKPPVVSVPDWSPTSNESSVVQEFVIEQTPRDQPHNNTVLSATLGEAVHEAWQTPESWLPVQELVVEPARSQTTAIDSMVSTEQVVPGQSMPTFADQGRAKTLPSTTTGATDTNRSPICIKETNTDREPNISSSQAVMVNDAQHMSKQLGRATTSYYLSGSDDEIESDEDSDQEEGHINSKTMTIIDSREPQFVLRPEEDVRMDAQLSSSILRACQGQSNEHPSRSEHRASVERGPSRLIVQDINGKWSYLKQLGLFVKDGITMRYRQIVAVAQGAKFRVEDVELLVRAGHGPYLVLMNTKTVLDCYEHRGDCDFSMINCVRHAYVCDEDLTGLEFDQVQPSWRPAVKNVDIKQGINGGSPYAAVCVKLLTGRVELFTSYGSGAYLAVPHKKTSSTNPGNGKGPSGASQGDSSSKSRLSLVTRSSTNPMGKRDRDGDSKGGESTSHKKHRNSHQTRDQSRTAAISRIMLQDINPEHRSVSERRSEIAKANYRFTSINELAPAARSTREKFQVFWSQKYPGIPFHDNLTETIPMDEAELVIAEFATVLINSGLSVPMVNRALDVLKMLHEVSGGSKADQLFSRERRGMIGTVLASAQKDTSEIRDSVKQSVQNSFLPVPDCMVEAQLRQFELCTWEADMIRKGATAVYLLCYNFGGRISNYVVGDVRRNIAGAEIRNTHYIRCVDAHFTLQSPDHPTGDVKVMADCKSLREALGSSYKPFVKWVTSNDVNRVQSIDLRFITSKTSKTSKDRGLSAGSKLRRLSRSSQGEAKHVEILALWVANCGTDASLDRDTPLFSFHSSTGVTASSRNIRAKEVKSELRKNAELEGLDPTWFSTRSFRITYSTAAALKGVPLQEINAHGGWAVNSTVAARNYSKVMESRSTAALVREEGGGISPELVRNLGFGRNPKN